LRPKERDDADAEGEEDEELAPSVAPAPKNAVNNGKTVYSSPKGERALEDPIVSTTVRFALSPLLEDAADVDVGGRSSGRTRGRWSCRFWSTVTSLPGGPVRFILFFPFKLEISS
jgi:hypothetical protein